MGLFSKKPVFGNYKYEVTLKKCVGYVAGEIQYFWGVKLVTEIQKKGQGYDDLYRASIPEEYDGLPVLVILDGALKKAPPVRLGSKLVAINCNQGTPYGGPFVDFGVGSVSKWQGAIFTFDETHPMFSPLAFDPSDITYGMVATYWNEGYEPSSLNYEKWLKEQLRGDGKDVGHNNNGLYSFTIFEGEQPDWNSMRRFLVKDLNAVHPFAFKCMNETVTVSYDAV
jgi:hypothetical protein